MDTTAIDYGINKLTAAFEKLASSEITAEFVRYSVFETVSAFWILLSVTLMLLTVVVIGLYFMHKRPWGDRWVFVSAISAALFVLTFTMFIVQTHDMLCAKKYPEMYAIDKVISKAKGE